MPQPVPPPPPPSYSGAQNPWSPSPTSSSYSSWGALGNAFNNVQGPQMPGGGSSYDANGYQNYQSIPDYTNPYNSLLNQAYGMMGQDSSMAGSQSQQTQGMLQNQMAQGLQQFKSMYPSYPNGAGAGSQKAGMQGEGDNGGGTNMQPNISSQGLNPWSLTGEALSRK